MTDTISESAEKAVEKPWQFKRGQSGNPGGRPKGCDPRLTLLKALAKVEKEKGITFAEHFVNEAFKADSRYPTLAVALARKIWADLTNETGDGGPARIEIHYTFIQQPPAVSPTNRVSPVVNGNG